jgi:hypothetical protein
MLSQNLFAEKAPPKRWKNAFRLRISECDFLFNRKYNVSQGHVLSNVKEK